MKRFLQICFISLAALIFVSNNIVLQYVEKMTIEQESTQDNDCNEKEMDDKKFKYQEIISLSFGLNNDNAIVKQTFLTYNCNFYSIFLDIEIPPPNKI